MPNLENMQKWIDALRSGKYQQGTGRLKNGTNYCCLGVLCEISGQGTFGNDTFYETNSKYNLSHIPGPEVSTWLGVDTDEHEHMSLDVPIGNIRMSLWTINDSLGLTFNQIADVLEENFMKEKTSA